MLTIQEMRTISASTFRKRKRLKGLNKGRRVKRTLGGSKFKTTLRTYKALMRQNRRPKRAGTIRKMLRTRKIHAKRLGGAYGMREAAGTYQHGETFLTILTEFAEATKREDIVADLLESLDPRFTSTKIGVAALSVAEKVDAHANIGTAFFDMAILDDSTVALYFEKAEALTVQVIEKALAEHGKVTLLVKPEDDLSEKEKSDVFMFALTIEDAKLSGIEVDEKIEVDDKGEPKLDEKTLMDDAAYAAFAAEVVKTADALV